MTYFASLLRQITVDAEQDPISWPADLILEVEIAPSELFGRLNASSRSIVAAPHGTVNVMVDGVRGTMNIASDEILTATSIHGALPNGSLDLTGNMARLQLRVASEQALQLAVEWLTLGLGPLLSVQVGVFVEVKAIMGTLAGRQLAAPFADGTYSALFAFLNQESRDRGIERALQSVRQDDPSFSRFTIASLYYHQALRLLSPHEVKFVPYVAHAEIMLNLVKCLEILFVGGTFEQVRGGAKLLGFDEASVESQIIPIFIIRNQFDVAHARARRPDPKDVKLLRNYIDRSVLNVGFILRQSARLIREGRAKLPPLTSEEDVREAAFKLKLREYLSGAPLYTADESPTIITTGG